MHNFNFFGLWGKHWRWKNERLKNRRSQQGYYLLMPLNCYNTTFFHFLFFSFFFFGNQFHMAQILARGQTLQIFHTIFKNSTTGNVNKHVEIMKVSWAKRTEPILNKKQNTYRCLFSLSWWLAFKSVIMQYNSMFIYANEREF